jgi:hypothetical protein
MDYIHELQNFYDTNLLDKENSHFLIADLTVSTIELLKEKEERHLAKTVDSKNKVT